MENGKFLLVLLFSFFLSLSCCERNYQRNKSRGVSAGIPPSVSAASICIDVWGQLKNWSPTPGVNPPPPPKQGLMVLGSEQRPCSRKRRFFLVSLPCLASSSSVHTMFAPWEQGLNSQAVKHSGSYTARRRDSNKGSSSGCRWLFVCLWMVASCGDTNERDCPSSWVPMWSFDLISLLSLLCKKILEKK